MRDVGSKIMLRPYTYMCACKEIQALSRLQIYMRVLEKRLRWVDNIRMDLQEVGCAYVDWIGLAQDRDRWGALVSAVMNLRVP